MTSSPMATAPHCCDALMLCTIFIIYSEIWINFLLRKPLYGIKSFQINSGGGGGELFFPVFKD